MMKKSIIAMAIAATLVIGGIACAAPISYQLPLGTSLIAVPQVPLNADPVQVFKTAGGASINIDNILTRMDNVSKSYFTYTSDIELNAYGGVLLGDGAWMFTDPAQPQVTWSYDAAPNGLPGTDNLKTDMWISLPVAGDNLIGMPFNTAVDWSTCKITDGTSMKNVADAGDWFTTKLIGMDASGSYYTIGWDPELEYSQLEPWHGYWCTTFVDNLALIVTAPN